MVTVSHAGISGVTGFLNDEVTDCSSKELAIDKGFPMMDWNANGYSNRDGIFYKDGKEITVPICRECQVQAPCSDWGGEYPYEN